MKLGVNFWTVYSWRPLKAVSNDVIKVVAEMGMGSRCVELVMDDLHNTSENWIRAVRGRIAMVHAKITTTDWMPTLPADRAVLTGTTFSLPCKR